MEPLHSLVWCLLASSCIIQGMPHQAMSDSNLVIKDPYTGELLHLDYTQGQQNDECYLAISNRSAKVFESLQELYHPNFVHFKLIFIHKNVSATKQTILPYNWVWTYYSPNGFFPYLKWPVDFPILSFGLLDVKTLPKKNMTVWLNMHVTGQCNLTIGEPYTTRKIAYALRDLTHDYILKLNPTSFSFSYWCYLTEVPNVTRTTGYLLGVYLGFPVNVAGYKCCRTDVPKTSNGEMLVECMNHIVPKMFQVTVIPYIIGLIAFAYFPVFLMTISERLISYGNTLQLSGSIQDKNSWEVLDEKDNEWLYLNGVSSPLTLTSLVCGLCNIAERHPIAVSRLRRILFIILSPCVVFVKLYAYGSYQFDLTMALLEHNVPMGYLSMLGGFEKSKENFVPALGGPYVLLGMFLSFGIIFIVLPKNLNSIVHEGASRRQINSRGGSPLFLDEEGIESLSGIDIVRRHGYGKAAAMCTGGLLMLTNPSFWSYLLDNHYQRLIRFYNNLRRRSCPNIISFLLFAVCLPVILLVYTIEVCLCIIFYGIPSVRFIFIAAKGYVGSITRLFIHRGSTHVNVRSPFVSHILNTTKKLFRYSLAVITFGMFAYFVFSFCTIFTTAFSFVAKLLVFSLVAVIVYPSYAFGYLFFFAALLYYIYKLLKSFGDGYSELLTEAVETSVQLADDRLQFQVFNGTVCLSRTNEVDIQRIQVHDSVVTLTPDQVMQIKEATPSPLNKIREKDHLVGIPRELFDTLVRKHRPVHHEVAKSLVWLVFVMSLITITISIIVVKNISPEEGMSEIMHVLFIMVVGALPEVLGIIIDTSDHSVKKEIRVKKLKATIEEYWKNKRHSLVP